MKKNLFSLLAMAALAVVFTACSQNEELSSSDQKSVFVKLDIGQGTRAIQAPFGSNPATVSSLRIYFHNGTSILKMVSITTSTTPSIATLTSSGAKISDVPSGATHVTVLGNLPTGLSVPTSGTIASVKNTVLNVATQTTASGVLLIGNDGTLQSASTTPPAWVTTIGGVVAGDLYAEVAIAPAFARVEIEGMKSKATSVITGYKLKGIFLNNIYDEIQLNGTLPASATLKNNGPDPTKYEQNVTGGTPVYASANPGILHDWFSPLVNASLVAGDGYQITAGSGMRWAYQVVPNAGNTANTQLQVIVRLSDVTATGLTYTGDQFLTIRGFLDSTTGNLVPIEAGKIYTISTADFAFDENNITDTPVTEAVGVYLKVTVTPWTSVAVKPNL